ncbi:bestrophin-like domain [Streptomyces vinaceus]|uniref:bestrophin-like domain n=1 Tax=Streptomyces vinaceus TaxID=1960 RepID=UPI0036AE10A7
MKLWLLNHLPTTWLALLVVGGIIAAALVGSVLATRFFPALAGGENNDMVGVVLGMFGAIYGIILAFVIVNLWTDLQNAETVVAAEASAVSQIARDAEAFPPDTRDAVHGRVREYVHAVVERQWPMMRAGRGDAAVTMPAVDGMYRVLAGYEPKSFSEQSFYQEALDSLNEVAAQRRARISESHNELPALLQVLIFGGAAVIVVVSLFYGVRNRRVRLLFVGAVAALIGFSLLLVIVLDCPFAGDMSVSAQPFKDSALARFW